MPNSVKSLSVFLSIISEIYYDVKSCETCSNSSDVTDDPLNLYNAKCYSCKQASDFSLPSSYEIRYDRDRMRCNLCLKTDNGCYFKK